MVEFCTQLYYLDPPLLLYVIPFRFLLQNRLCYRRKCFFHSNKRAYTSWNLLPGIICYLSISTSSMKKVLRISILTGVLAKEEISTSPLAFD
jgi:hypothetical protein